MDLELRGRRALVSGASRGLGFAVADRLAREGADVAITSLDPARLELARDRLGAHGGRVLAAPADLGDESAVRRMLAMVDDAFGGIDILVANTGGPPLAPILDVEPQQWRASVEDMLLPVVAMTRATVAGMRARGWGRVVVMTSSWVKQPRPSGGLSAAVRSAVSAFAKQLAIESAADNVLVNQVLPGPCWTERSENVIQRLAEQRGLAPEVVKADIVRELPLGRYGRPEEVADVVAFLASERASYVTGAAIPVEGGQIRSTL